MYVIIPPHPIPPHPTPPHTYADVSKTCKTLVRFSTRWHKHGQEELQSNLRPPCNTPVRAKRFWLIRLKVDQALVGLLACHAECSSEVAQYQRSPTHLHSLQPFFGKSQDGLTSADAPKTTKITKLYIYTKFKLSSMQIVSNPSSLLVLTCSTCVSRQWLRASC